VKLLLLGAGGQVGGRLAQSLQALGEVIPLDHGAIDLTDAAALASAVQSSRADIVVNAAAYTAVDRAEDEPETAFAINAIACDVLARETKKSGAWLVHYSSDYVYDGSGEQPLLETGDTRPLSVYGRSKLAGDQAILSQNPRHIILRTSWVYDSLGQNFIKSILNAAATRDSLTVVADQWGAPTGAPLIAQVTAQLLRAPRAGLYHLAPAGFTNWHAYAQEVVAQGIAHGMALRTTPDKVLPIPSSAWPVKARRPANSRLDTTKLQTTFGITLPPWQDGVRACVADLADGSSRPSV